MAKSTMGFNGEITDTKQRSYTPRHYKYSDSASSPEAERPNNSKTGSADTKRSLQPTNTSPRPIKNHSRKTLFLDLRELEKTSKKNRSIIEKRIANKIYPSIQALVLNLRKLIKSNSLNIEDAKVLTDQFLKTRYQELLAKESNSPSIKEVKQEYRYARKYLLKKTNNKTTKHTETKKYNPYLETIQERTKSKLINSQEDLNYHLNFYDSFLTEEDQSKAAETFKNTKRIRALKNKLQEKTRNLKNSFKDYPNTSFGMTSFLSRAKYLWHENIKKYEDSSLSKEIYKLIKDFFEYKLKVNHYSNHSRLREDLTKATNIFGYHKNFQDLYFSYLESTALNNQEFKNIQHLVDEINLAKKAEITNGHSNFYDRLSVLLERYLTNFIKAGHYKNASQLDKELSDLETSIPGNFKFHPERRNQVYRSYLENQIKQSPAELDNFVKSFKSNHLDKFSRIDLINKYFTQRISADYYKSFDQFHKDLRSLDKTFAIKDKTVILNLALKLADQLSKVNSKKQKDIQEELKIFLSFYDLKSGRPER